MPQADAPPDRRRVDADGEGVELGAVVTAHAYRHDRAVALGRDDLRIVAADEVNRLRPRHRRAIAVPGDVPHPEEAGNPVVGGS